MYQRVEDTSAGVGTEKSWIPPETDRRMVFSVFANQFKRGMINIAGAEAVVTVEDGEIEGKRVVLERNRDEVICRYREDTRGNVLVVFTRYEDAAWFEDGLSY